MLLRRSALGIVVLVLLACAQVRDASAHASLIKAEPADGVVLQQAPSVLTLTFNEPVSPLVFRLIGPTGEAVTPVVAAANDTVTLTPPRQLAQGTHLLSWRVVSADGHPVGGSLVFSVGAPSARPTDAAPHGDIAVRGALWVMKIIIYIGLFIGIGGAFFRAWVAGPATPGPRGWLIAALGTGCVAAVYSISFQGLDALDLPYMDALDPRTWTAGMGTSYALTALAAAVALLVAMASLPMRGRPVARVLALVAICGAAFAPALSGHAATAPPRWLTSPSVFLHVLSVTFWIGSLAPLIAATRACDVVALMRFSRVVPYPVALVVATGVALAFVQLDRIDALWTTDYGLVLSAKLAAVATLLALAAGNRFWLTPRVEAQNPRAVRALVRSIAVELILALVIVSLVALWRFTPPPRALAAAEPTSIHFHGERAMAQIEVEPVRARGAEVDIQVLDNELRPLAAKEVTLALSNPAAGIEPVRRSAKPGPDAHWRIDRLRIPVAGRWRLRVEILIDDFDKVVLEDDVELPRAP